MWPYFCHNPTSIVEGRLYFYMTTIGIHVTLHAYLADMLPMIVLVMYMYLYSNLKLTSIIPTCMDSCTSQGYLYFYCYCVLYTQRKYQHHNPREIHDY